VFANKPVHELELLWRAQRQLLQSFDISLS